MGTRAGGQQHGHKDKDGLFWGSTCRELCCRSKAKASLPVVVTAPDSASVCWEALCCPPAALLPLLLPSGAVLLVW